MPPKAALKHQDDGKDEVVSAFTQLASALSNAARIVETYTAALSQGGLSVHAAGEGYAAALKALDGGASIKAEGAVTGKKRGRPSAAADDAEPGKRKQRVKKEKKWKDPLAPKRPASAYLLYQNDKRAEFVERFKDIPYHEMLSKISESWGKLTDAEKQPYTAAQAKLKADYEGRKQAYEVSKSAPVAEVEVELEEDDEDELDVSPAPVKAANGEAESEDDEDSDEESDEAEQVKEIVAKAKDDDDEDSDDDDDDGDDDSETSEDEEPPRKKAKGAAPISSTKKASAPAKPASKPASKKSAASAPAKEKKAKKTKD